MRIILIIIFVIIIVLWLKHNRGCAGAGAVKNTYNTLKYQFLMLLNVNYDILLKVYHINNNILNRIQADSFKEIFYFFKIPYQWIDAIKIVVQEINNMLKVYIKWRDSNSNNKKKD